MKIWILTMEANDCDQHGEYFIQAFKTRPTEDDLVEAGVPKPFIISPTQSGEWIGCDHVKDMCWYLREHCIGQEEKGSDEEFLDSLTEEEFYSVEGDGNRLSMHNKHLKDVI